MVVVHELLTCINKNGAKLRGSISQTRQEVVPTTAFTKIKSRRSYFISVKRKLKEKLNVHVDNLYQSPR